MDSNNIYAYKIENMSTSNKENISTTSYSVATLISKSTIQHNNTIGNAGNNNSTTNPLNNSINILSSLNNTINNMNESFDCEKARFDALEKQIKKLNMENKSLRKRVQNLTELARNKEEELLNAFNEACEDKRKNEELNQIEHNSQLQSYYECFLQIEKENDSLKRKLEQMKLKLNEKQKSNDEKNSQQEKSQDTPNSFENENGQNREEINQASMKHIDEELNNLNRSIKTFIEDSKQRKMSMGAAKVQENNEELELKNQRIEELELEREALNKKVNSIEASLARWIFKSCDYQTEASKCKEKLSELETKMSEYETDKSSSQNEIDDLKLRLEEKLAENEKLKKSLDSSLNEISKLNLLINELKEKNEKLEQKAQVLDAQTQTLNEPFTKLLVSNKSSSLVAQTAAKLSQLINNDDYKNASNQPQMSIIESLNNEIEHLKSRLDTVQLEKNTFKSKSEELKQELDILIKKANTNNNPPPLTVKKLVTATNVSVSAQTHQIKLINSHTQTVSQTQNETPKSNTIYLAEIEQLKCKLDSVKKEFDQLKMKSQKDQIDWQNKLDEKLNEIQKLEQIIQGEKTQNLQLNKKIIDLNEKLDKMSQDMDTIKKSYESKLAQCNQDYKIEKEISGTIIQQQKKLLDFMQLKLGGGTFAGYVAESQNHPNNNNENHHGHHNNNIISLINKKFKSTNSNSNPLLANLQKTTNQQYLNNKQQNSAKKTTQLPVQPTEVKNVSEIEAELNSNYVTYSELSKKNDQKAKLEVKIELNYNNNENNQIVSKPATVSSTKKQIHVFITGLNTCPTYCHVCQQLIPLIAYASKCQLCSFTCHSNCSASSSNSKSKSFKQTSNQPNNLYDPLKYCHINYLTNGIDYNNYINKVISFNSSSATNRVSGQPSLSNKQNNILLGDYLYINVDNKWKKLWLTLRLDQPQLDLYQTKQNQKPFDTINLLNDKCQIETNIAKIKKLITSNSSSNSAVLISLNQENASEDLYEDINENSLINFDQSSLIILLHSPKLCLQIGFTSFNKKNIWYDALQTSILLAQSINLNKRSLTSLTSSSMQNNELFKCFDMEKVLKPFLEFVDTIVNSYCLIHDNLIVLACDDGLYALNSIATNNDIFSNLSLVKIDGIESAHKLYYQPEYGKLCLIGRKCRQFLSIDIQELNESLIKGDYSTNNNTNDYEDDENLDDDDEAKSIRVRLESIHDIDRCHLFESSHLTGQDGVWYLSVATPETIFILMYNKQTNKYNMIKTIPTSSDSPCLCLKFTQNVSQLIYGLGGNGFYRCDLKFFQSAQLIDDKQKKFIIDDLNLNMTSSSQPVSICSISEPNSKKEAILLCFEEYGLFLVYNFNLQQWQIPQSNSKSSSSSQLSNNNNNNVSYIKWPRGNCLTPLQIEFDRQNLYLFYNDSIIVYQIKLNITMDDTSCFIDAKKLGITFVYKPRYLSSFDSASTHCLIISNKRPLDSTEANNTSNNEYSELNGNDELDPVNGKSSKLNNPIIQDLNNKICLSYFSPDSNN